LQVTGGGVVGTIFIANGAIIHAEAGEMKGEAALQKLLGLAGGDFKMLPYTEAPEKTIEGQWEFLLMEAAQKRDEAPAPPEKSPEEEFIAGIEVAPAKVAAERQRTRIDELMICSEAGDVLLAWECRDADMRINFLEFVSQKARLLRNALPLGTFDRVEFRGPEGRLVAQISAGRGIVVRSSPVAAEELTGERKGPPAPASASPRVKSKGEEMFRKALTSPGLLGATLHFVDGTGLSDSVSPSVKAEALDVLRRSANDGFRVLGQQGFRATRARWSFADAVLECANWERGACLAMAVSRHAFDLDPAGVSRAAEMFADAEMEKG
jgi:hypothetical protein